MTPPTAARWHQVLELVAQGYTNQQIARRLYVTESTVKTHLHRLFTNLEVDTRAHLVAVAHDRRLLTTPAVADGSAVPAALWPLEIALLDYLGRGMRIGQIAPLVDLTVDQVKQKLSTVYEVLDVESAVHAVEIAHQTGQLPPSHDVPPIVTALAARYHYSQPDTPTAANEDNAR